MIHNWRKATFSADNSTCLETGWADGMVGYRDTKQPDRPALLVGADAARAFLAMITR
ncbi:MAG: DUF397 domain-containing protein [Kibdelosporangium sp.]